MFKHLMHGWLAAMAVTLLLAAAPAQAQNIVSTVTNAVTSATSGATGNTTSDQTCTTIQANKDASLGANAPDTGLLTEIYTFIKTVVGSATQTLFNAFTQNANYQNAVMAAMVLMVIFYGVGFTIGVTQASFAQVLVKLLKLGIVAAVISPTGWTFFSQYAVNFFMNGTDELVKGVVEIGMGTSGTAVPADASPFYELDKMANFLIQPDTLTQIMASVVAGGPYGMAMGGLLGIASWGFMKMIISALRIYASTFVARSLLLGIAPIFVVFLLFDKTKQLFVSWLQALISLSLQPILLFTFLSFFLLLIETAMKDMMSAEVCWTPYANTQGNGSPVSFWRFKDPKTGELWTSNITWKGSMECLLEGQTDSTKQCPEFPLSIVDILSFLILVYIASRFSDVVTRMANELSNTYVALDAGGKVDQFLSQAGQNLFGPSSKSAPAKKR